MQYFYEFSSLSFHWSTDFLNFIENLLMNGKKGMKIIRNIAYTPKFANLLVNSKAFQSEILLINRKREISFSILKSFCEFKCFQCYATMNFLIQNNFKGSYKKNIKMADSSLSSHQSTDFIENLSTNGKKEMKIHKKYCVHSQYWKPFGEFKSISNLKTY